MELFGYHQICQLNEKEFAVYNYISSHMEQVVCMNIRQLSAVCGVSTTTILRFCQKVDCQGYTELKYELKRHLQKDNSQIQKKFDLDPILQYLKKMEQQTEAENTLKKIADACALAKNIYVIGGGASGNLAAYGAHTLTYVGKMALAITDIQYPYPPYDLEETVVLALSISGKNHQLITQVNQYKQKKARIFSITNTDECPLARISEFNISYFMPSLLVKDEFQELNLISQMPVLYTLERIAFEVHQRLVQNQQNES